jgi:hypothetical protein
VKDRSLYGPWDVTPSNVLALRPADLQALVTDLVRAEVSFRSRDVAALGSVHGAPDAERKDGSIDLLIEHFDGQSQYVPIGRSTWHVTSGENHARKAERWARGQLHADAVRSERERGATTVLVLVARTSAQTALLEKLDDRVRVLTADKIAAWATQHNFGLRLHGRPGLQPLKSALAVMPGGRIHFQWTEDRLAAKEKIWSYVRGASQSPMHIEGAAGIGKTRLVLETLDRLSGFGERAIYVRDGHWTPALAHDLLLGIEADRERTAILVLDECDAGSHARWVEQVSPLNAGSARVWLITISTSTLRDADGDSVVIERLSDAELTRFLRAEYQLPEGALTAIVGECKGFIKAAVFLADHCAKDPSRLLPADWALRADRDDMFKRALGDDADLVGPVALLSEATEEDRKVLAHVLELRVTDIERAMSRLYDRGLTQPRADAVYLTPEILANTLALRQVRQLRTALSDRLVRLFESLPHRGKLAMLQRLLLLRPDPDVEALLQKILGKLGGSGAPPTGRGREVAEYLASLLTARPADVLSIVLRWIEQAGPTNVASARSDLSPLVKVLEPLAHSADFFDSAASALATLAEAETTYGDGGPAAKRWTALFSIGVARTEASNEQRVSALLSAAASPRPARRRLAMRAAGRILAPSGIWLPDDLLVSRPLDRADVSVLFRTAWSVLIGGLLDSDAAIGEMAGSILGDHYKYSLRTAPDQVLDAIEGAPIDAPRVRAVLRSLLALEQFSPQSSAPVRERLRALAKRLEGQSFGERLRYWVGEGSPGESAGGEALEQAKAAWCELASMAVEQPALLAAEQGWLSSPEARSALMFGEAIGRADPDRRLLPMLGEQLAEGRGIGVTTGYLRAQLDAAEEERPLEALLDDWARRGGYFSHAVSEVTWRGKTSEKALERWLRMVRLRVVAPGVLSLAIWGNWHMLPAPAIVDLLACARESGDAGACAGALTVAARWQETRSPTDAGAGAVEKHALAVIEQGPHLFSAGGAAALTAIGALRDVLGRLLHRSPVRAAETLIGLLSRSDVRESDLVELLARALRREPEAVLSLIDERLRSRPERREEVLDHLDEFAQDVLQTLGKPRSRRGRYMVLNLGAPASA